MTSHSAPTRTLPSRPSLAQLRKQARELLNSYRAGEAAATGDAVESGADRWARPLAWATKRGHQAVIELLRSHGAR